MIIACYSCVYNFSILCVAVCRSKVVINIMNKNVSNLLVLALNSNELDGRGCDVDLDLDMSGCCCFSKYPHSVLMSVMHGHAPNRVSIYY